MTIVVPPAPDSIGAAIFAPLAHLLAARRQPASDKVGGAANSSFAAPMPLYVIGLGEAASGHWLASAHPSGWRTLIVGPLPDEAPIAVADTRPGRAGEAQTFGGLIRGALAARLHEAATLASELYGHQTAGYEARVLEIPAIYRTALWLHGARDIFFPVLESATGDASPVAQDEAFLARIQDAARQRLAAAG